MARAPVPKVTVNIRIGTKRDTITSTNQSVGETVADGLFGDIETRARRDRVVDVERLKAILPAQIEAEYVRGINWGIKNLIGSMSPRGINMAKTFNSMGDFGVVDPNIKKPIGYLEWKGLSTRTIQDKMKAGREPRAFFINTGSLKSKLLAQARAIVGRTGKTQVVTTAPPIRGEKGRWQKQKIIRITDLQIRLMPNIPSSLLPGLHAGDFGYVDPKQGFEAKVLRSPEVQKKLLGPGSRHTDASHQRPFLQPIFTYWTSFYIPARIARQIQRLVQA